VNALPVIAIDGTAACGKGTLAKKLAEYYGFAHLDSGALYRLVALNVLERGGNPSDVSDATRAARAIDIGNTSLSQIRRDEVGKAASQVAAIPEVRNILLSLQREFAARPPDDKRGAVIDGRDIGTEIVPQATAKLFVDAAPEIRASRRRLELESLGIFRDEKDILEELKARDAADMSRKVSPLRQAEDAMLLDTSELGIDAAFAAALALVEPKIRPIPNLSARSPSEGA
jgi:cytidylate kinase